MIIKRNLARTVSLLLPLTLLVSNSVHAHAGSSSNAAWDACTSKPRSQSCEYKGFHGERYIGTCQVVSESMICVRNKPIIYPEPIEEHAEEKSKAPAAPTTSPEKPESK